MCNRKLAKIAFITVAFVISTMFVPIASRGQTWSEWGAIQYIEAGWKEDTMAVFHSAGMVNPNGCKVTNAGYATNPNDPGHSLFHTLVLSALLNKKQTRFLISECVYSKPRIIAVGVR